MKVLVTGGSGFIGGRIVRRLVESDHEVHVLGRSTFPQEDGIRFHKVDLAREDIPAKTCDGVEAIFHVAAKAGVGGSFASYHAANVLATRRILDTCRSHHIGLLVHTSSPSVVFNRYPFRGADESLPYGRNWQRKRWPKDHRPPPAPRLGTRRPSPAAESGKSTQGG